MAKYDKYRVRFDTTKGKKINKYPKPDQASEDYLRRVIKSSAYYDSDDRDTGTYDDWEELKIFAKKKGRKALLKGKVINADRKKYKKWRKHDKKIVQSMVAPMLQDLYDDGVIGYKKAKKLKKITTRRILSCFYGKEKD